MNTSPPPFHPETDHWLLLSLIPGISSRTLFQLVELHPDPKEILTLLNSSEWRHLPLHSIAKQWLGEHSGRIEQSLATKIAQVQTWREQGGTVVCWKDAKYPQALKEIYDPPVLLYALGDIRYLVEENAMAVVGSRKATRYGIEMAQQFGYQLAHSGWNVISGLALGIDGAAHMGALQANGAGAGASTVAVVATGLDQVYPSSHRRLHQQILERGCIISEYPLGTLPRPNYFPRRNRIITGLAKGVLVVEASEKSGSLVSARCALEQNREVFAVPGMLNNPQASGCHTLIQQGAKLVTCIEDIVEEMIFKNDFKPSIRNDVHLPQQNTLCLDKAQDVPKTEALNTDALKSIEIHHSLSEQEPPKASEHPILNVLGTTMCTADELILRTGLNWAELSQQLLTLELSGDVISTQGGYMRSAK